VLSEPDGVELVSASDRLDPKRAQRVVDVPNAARPLPGREHACPLTADSAEVVRHHQRKRRDPPAVGSTGQRRSKTKDDPLMWEERVKTFRQIKATRLAPPRLPVRRVVVGKVHQAQASPQRYLSDIPVGHRTTVAWTGQDQPRDVVTHVWRLPTTTIAVSTPTTCSRSQIVPGTFNSWSDRTGNRR
jgi:hypothetical protein